MVNMKCHTKNIFFLSKRAVGHVTFVNQPTGQLLSIKVPQGTIKIINILY